ncbi:hypothetical protein D3C78_442380 [compost metagenome]
MTGRSLMLPINALPGPTPFPPGSALCQASSSLPGFSYSPRQAVVSAPSKTTNQLRVFTKAQTNRMDIGANNEQLTQASSSLPGFSYSPRQAVVSAPSKTTNQLR